MLRELHEFNQNYGVISATYYVDDCIVHQMNDTALLRKPAVNFETRKIPAGSRRFRYAIKFRSGFAADMPSHEWMTSGDKPMKVHEGGTTSITVRLFEDERVDPRNRMRTVIMQGVSQKGIPVQ